jgi:hypothetical protein
MASPSDPNNQPTGWVGWIAFASAMMIIVGFFQMIYGFSALFNSTLIISGPEHIWLVDLTTWGWIHILFGVLLLAGGLSLGAGQLWAQIFAVILAGLSAIANFAFIPTYPIWSILVITMDVLIIFAITAHGGEIREI